MNSEKYDRFVGRNVILTNWNGLKQKVKIIANDKQGKKLNVDNNGNGIHYLTYANIGEDCAVTKIDFDSDKN
tara:strand:- start:472 stop:687 length:216 start_codon:yes stop_codon:yes gene_type:complete